jgi:hypothetical protein
MNDVIKKGAGFDAPVKGLVVEPAFPAVQKYWVYWAGGDQLAATQYTQKISGDGNVKLCMRTGFCPFKSRGTQGGTVKGEVHTPKQFSFVPPWVSLSPNFQRPLL